MSFDRIEVTIRGYKDKKVLSTAQCWTLDELKRMPPTFVSCFVHNKVADMTQALTNELDALESE